MPPDPYDPNDARATAGVIDGATALGRLAAQRMAEVEQRIAARTAQPAQPSGVRWSATHPPLPPDATALQRHREAAGFTRGALARASGIDAVEIAAIEGGGLLRTDAARKLAAALAIDPDELNA